MVRTGLSRLSLVIGIFLLQACEEGLPSDFAEFEEPLVLQDSKKKLDISVCAPTPANFPSPLTSTNPYFPIEPVGSQWTLEGEEDGTSVKAVITVLNRTRMIDGVNTRVIEEREFEAEEGEDLEEVEISWNYYRVTTNGTVCYAGEDVDDIEVVDDTPVVVGHEGAWCAEDDPEDENKSGIFMAAESDLRPGTEYLQEFAPGIALDGVRIVGIGPVTVPYGTFTETIRFREFDFIEGKKGDYKVFAKDDFGAGNFQGGTVIDGPLQLTDFSVGTGEPESEISVQECGS
jgi:hypothetical protein